VESHHLKRIQGVGHQWATRSWALISWKRSHGRWGHIVTPLILVLIKDYSRQDKSTNNIIECMCTDGHAVKEEKNMISADHVCVMCVRDA